MPSTRGLSRVRSHAGPSPRRNGVLPALFDTAPVAPPGDPTHCRRFTRCCHRFLHRPVRESSSRTGRCRSDG